jgi:integral membrane protein
MKSTLLRFRVMAIIAGIMSLLLWFIDLPVVYLFDNADWKAAVAWIPFVHGWIYLAYVLTALQFSVKAHWPIKKILWLLLAGTLPVASLIAERRVVRRYS